MVGEGVVRDVILRDGSTLRLRSAAPEDFDDLVAFYDGLSEQSRYLRFHGFGRTDVAARDYAEADGDARVALIGRQAGRVVAAAGYDRLREPGAAEVAFTVADDFQGRGTATRLLEQLASIASGRAIQRFDAEVMSDNRAMLAVFKRGGFGLRRQGAFGEVVVSLDIRPDEDVEDRIAERDHRGAVASLRPILAPAAIAVVGASRRPGSVGHGVLANVLEGDFAGVVTPVSRTGGVVRSVRVVEGLGDLEEIPELVIVAVPAEDVLAVAAEAADRGARALVVLSEGFSETGEEGRIRQERLLDVVRAAGMRLVGPNSLGVINTDPAVSLNATVAGATVAEGRLAICSQSGAIGLGLLGHAAARHLGISSFASLGNRADVSTNDLLEYWEEDERTAAVMLYVQTFGNPERFTRIARRVSQRKPILVIKALQMDAAQEEARSHTAAARRGDAVVDALLRHAGVLRFRSGDELFNAAQFFEAQPLPRGRRVGVVSNSTGVATLATDACAARGLAVPELHPSTVEELGGRSTGANPLNLGIYADAPAYAAAVEAILADEGIDAVMAFYVDLAGGDPPAVLERLDQLSEGHDKPVVASVVTAEGRLPRPVATATAQGGRVPNFLFPEACAGVLARAVERREWLSRPLGARPRYADLDAEGARERITAWLSDGAGADGWMTTPQAQALLATHGIASVSSEACPDAGAAASAAERLGGPVALKADFPPPGHAGDVDAVLLGLDGPEAIRAGWREIERRVDAAGREWHGAIVQPLVPPGADVLVGAISDLELGPVMALGLGGRQAGLAGDVGFRLLPVTDVDADELLLASRSVAMQLDGFRGSPVLDRDALRELLLRFALLLREVPEIVDADLNPVRVMAKGAIVLDMRLRVEHHRRAAAVKTW